MCMNYNVDSNTKSLNYSKIWFESLIYFELQKSLNEIFELKPLQIIYQLNALWNKWNLELTVFELAVPGLYAKKKISWHLRATFK